MNFLVILSDLSDNGQLDDGTIVKIPNGIKNANIDAVIGYTLKCEDT